MNEKLKKFGISKRIKKKEDKSNVPQVFGVPFDRTSNTIPQVIKRVVEYFNVKGVEIEGLFRISGSFSEVSKLKTEFDEGKNPELFDIEDPHVCAALLKQYLRELPEPLLTFELYDCFLASASVPEEALADTIRKVLTMLPLSHRIILKYLISFLSRVSLASDINKMTPSNIAIVFAPNLLKPDTEDISMQISDTPYSNKLMELFVQQYAIIFKDEPDEPDPLRSSANDASPPVANNVAPVPKIMTNNNNNNNQPSPNNPVEKNSSISPNNPNNTSKEIKNRGPNSPLISNGGGASHRNKTVSPTNPIPSNKINNNNNSTINPNNYPIAKPNNVNNNANNNLNANNNNNNNINNNAPTDNKPAKNNVNKLPNNNNNINNNALKNSNNNNTPSGNNIPANKPKNNLNNSLNAINNSSNPNNILPNNSPNNTPNNSPNSPGGHLAAMKVRSDGSRRPAPNRSNSPAQTPLHSHIVSNNNNHSNNNNATTTSSPTLPNHKINNTDNKNTLKNSNNNNIPSANNIPANKPKNNLNNSLNAINNPPNNDSNKPSGGKVLSHSAPTTPRKEPPAKNEPKSNTFENKLNNHNNHNQNNDGNTILSSDNVMLTRGSKRRVAPIRQVEAPDMSSLMAQYHPTESTRGFAHAPRPSASHSSSPSTPPPPRTANAQKTNNVLSNSTKSKEL